MLRIQFTVGLWCCFLLGSAQSLYNPCFLKDSTDKNIEFIKRNTERIFTDTMECRQSLMDSIAVRFTESKDKKYLDYLNYIRVYGNEKVEGLFTDIVKRFCENDFSNFLNELYLSKGRLSALEKEMIVALNMIIDGRPLKQKFMGQLNVEISKAKDKRDTNKLAYLEKLKSKIENEKY